MTDVTNQLRKYKFKLKYNVCAIYQFSKRKICFLFLVQYAQGYVNLNNRKSS